MLNEASITSIAQKRLDRRSSTGAGKETFEKLLNEHPELDIVVFSNDGMAVGGYFHCMSAGIAVNDRVGYSASTLWTSAWPCQCSSQRSVPNATSSARPRPRSFFRPGEKTIIDTGYDIVDGARLTAPCERK